MKLYPELLDGEFWQNVRTNEAYADVLGHIKEQYEIQRTLPMPELPFSARNRFYDDGDRSSFEAPYFTRRIRLANAAIMSLVYPECDEYLHKVEDLIWMICDEYSWSLPAHCDGSYEGDTTSVDLFSSETALTLTEIAAFLKDRLHERVLRRVKIEVKSRVLENYVTHKFWWEKSANNWAAVCAGSIGMTMIYAEPEMLEKYLPCLLASVNCCLESYTPDGACLEGFDYWSYGFGYYCYFADMLRIHTNGRIDLFKNEKVKLMASFPSKNFMLGGTAVSFSDSNIYAKAPTRLVHLLAREYKDAAPLPTSDRLKTFDGRWVEMLRYFAFFMPDATSSEVTLSSCLLESAGQYITTRGNYSFAVKAGHNDEPHNHNDVGNFIIATKNGQELCDIGSGRYTRQYFRAATRYTIFCNSSESHSVPIINGTLQHEGREYRGDLSLDGNRVSLRIDGAYPIDIGKFERVFDLSNDDITLRDTWGERVNSITERFVSMTKPTLRDGRVLFGDVSMKMKNADVVPTVSIREELSHGNNTIFVYCIDYELDPTLDSAEFEFKVGGNA